MDSIGLTLRYYVIETDGLGERLMLYFMEVIEQHPVVILVSLFVGGSASIGVYQGILRIAKLETVQQGTYVKKSNLVGNLLRNEALQTIEHLIEIGTNEINRESGMDEQEAEMYMLRVHTFLHHLNLPKIYAMGSDKHSFAEQKIDHIIRDIPNTGKPPAPLVQKLSRIVGVLKGLKESLISRHS